MYFSSYGNAVYGGDNALLSLDARTGDVRWRVAGVFGPPAVAGGRVFVGTPAGQLQARSAATGALLWSRPGALGRSSYYGDAAPAVANGLVFAGLARGVGAWRLSDGVRRWTYGTVAYGAPVVSGGRLYVSAVTPDGDAPVAVVDQFTLGGAAAGAIS